MSFYRFPSIQKMIKLGMAVLIFITVTVGLSEVLNCYYCLTRAEKQDN
jgi:hypothetical protein